MDCRVGCLFLAVGLVGCFSDPPSGSGGGDASTGTSSTSADPSTTGDDTTGEPDDDSSTGFFPPETTGTSTGFFDTDCDGDVVEVPGRHAPIDLVVVVDSSASMADQAPDVITILDTLTLGVVDMLGDDLARLVWISDMTDPLGLCTGGVAGGWCTPREPRVTWADADTTDSDPLDAMVDVLVSGVDSLRPEAQKHIIVVTDEDTSVSPNPGLMSIVAVGPQYLTARLHAMTGCGVRTPNLNGLVDLSGGTLAPLCPLQSEQLIDAVSQPLAACSFDIPEEDIDGIGEVELFGGGATWLLEQVDQPSGCADAVNGALLLGGMGPLQLQLCPDTCREYQELTTNQPLGGVRLYPDACF